MHQFLTYLCKGVFERIYNSPAVPRRKASHCVIASSDRRSIFMPLGANCSFPAFKAEDVVRLSTVLLP